MKKLAVGLLCALSFLSLPTAHAETPVVRVVDKPHLNFDGTFRDNLLAQSLQPEGTLGKIVFSRSAEKRTWVIDPALIEEVSLMADGYTFDLEKDAAGTTAALRWLTRLRYATVGNSVIALPYGNPDQKFLKRYAPAELAFYSEYGARSLSALLGRAVTTENGWGKGAASISYEQRSQFLEDRKLLAGLSTISGAAEISDTRARMARSLNPVLNRKEREYFARTSHEAVKVTAAKLRVTSGRYQLTSKNVKLPITVVNNFDTETVVSVSLIPQNSRIQVANLNNVTLAARGRQQLTIPVSVIAPGTTLVEAQLMNKKGQLVGEISQLNLSATIIDSRVTWFTTGAAIVLFLGAIAQSVRRVKRSRHEK